LLDWGKDPEKKLGNGAGNTKGEGEKGEGRGTGMEGWENLLRELNGEQII